MKSIKSKLLFTLFYFLFWVIYFGISRLFFFLSYFQKAQDFSIETIPLTFFYGAYFDFSATAYLCILPFFLISFMIFIKRKSTLKIIKLYSFLVLLIINLLMLVDIGLYQAWGNRLDNSLLTYLNNPLIMLASISTMQLIFQLLLWIIITFCTSRILFKIIEKYLTKSRKNHWSTFPIFIFVTATLIIPLRGGGKSFQ